MTKKIITTICAFLLTTICSISITQNIVRADETKEYYEFKGSNIFMPFNASLGVKKGFSLLKFTFNANTSEPTNYKYSVGIVTTNFYDIKDNNTAAGTQENYYYFWQKRLSYTKNQSTASKLNWTLETLPIINTKTVPTLQGYLCEDGKEPNESGYYNTLYIKCEAFLNSKNFRPNIKTIQIGNSITDDGISYNYVRYVDDNSNFFEFAIETSKGQLEYEGTRRPMLLEHRQYVIGGTSSEYDTGYMLGLEEGKSEGIELGKDIGYKNGYDKANSELYNKWYIGRYQEGYNKGAENAGNYTFLSLMGSVVDAPIKAISNMLNFDLLGFNMAQFFFAILTVCIIVSIVKLLL